MTLYLVISSIVLCSALYFKGENLRKDVLNKEDKKQEKQVDQIPPKEYPRYKEWR